MKRLKVSTPFKHYKIRYLEYYWNPYNCVWVLGYRAYVDELYSPGTSAWRSEELKDLIKRKIYEENFQ